MVVELWSPPPPRAETLVASEKVPVAQVAQGLSRVVPRQGPLTPNGPAGRGSKAPTCGEPTSPSLEGKVCSGGTRHRPTISQHVPTKGRLGPRGTSSCRLKATPRGRASQPEPVPPQVPADGEGQGAPPLLLQKPLVSCVPHRHAQEVSRLCHLSAGTYRVVPSTYLPDTEGTFTVTIATRIDRWGSGGLQSSVQ